jgi:GAF domain
VKWACANWRDAGLCESVAGVADITVSSFAGEEALWRLTTVFARSVTPLDVAEALANEGALAADGVFANMAVLLGDSGQLQVVHRSVMDDSTGSRMFDINDGVPACEAIRSGVPVLLCTVEEIARRFPDALTDIYLAGLGARASLPLHASDGKVLGAVGFGWQHPQEFDEPLVRRLDLIAQLAGLALERSLRGGDGRAIDAQCLLLDRPRLPHHASQYRRCTTAALVE